MNGKELLDNLDSPSATEMLSSLYSAGELEANRQRYRRLIEGLLHDFPRQEFPEVDGGLRVFSVPGRSELGGNHTDHNRGKVLAASIQLDAVAVVAPRLDKQVFFRSVGHRDVIVDLSDLSLREREKGDTEALIRGIAAEFVAQSSAVGGFTANADNMVHSGSGLSSSAAVEVLFAKIFDNLYADGKRSALELAKIGQKAENVYFGKPCGLMDQTACASGGAVAIDFEDLQNPKVWGINFDPALFGYALCIVNTKGSHSDLTPDYAAIPREMKAVAAFFGKTVLREVDEETFMASIPALRKSAGDRSVLRAMHFYGENRRVDAMLAALKNMNAIPQDIILDTQDKAIDIFLDLVEESGDSSLELLQNIYSPKNSAEQGLTLALALTRNFIESRSGCIETDACANKGAWRVHGGGFAGTIQAYIPMHRMSDYRNLMEGVFGPAALTVLRVRPEGAIELDFGRGALK